MILETETPPPQNSLKDPFEKIAINRIICTTCLRTVKCKKCNTPINNGDILMQNLLSKKKAFSAAHLRCFSPLFHTLIKPNDIDTLLLNKENTKRVKNWIKFWNSKQISPISNVLLPCKTSSFFVYKTTEITKKMSFPLMISLTFLDLKEVLLNFALVSRFFYSLTFNNFFWKEICFILYKNEDVNKLIEKIYSGFRPINEEWKWKEICYLLTKNCCYECRKLDFNEMRICPILKKPLCENCRKKEKFRLVSISEMKRFYGGYLTHILDSFSSKFGWNAYEEKVFYRFYVEQFKKVTKSTQIKLKKIIK